MNIADYPFPLELKYTQRRGSVAFRVYPETVKILAPKGIRKRELQSLIDAKAQWLQESWEKAQRELASSASGRQYCTGELFPFLGHDYPISIIKTDRSHIELDSGELCIDLAINSPLDGQQQCEQLVSEWLQEQAESFLPGRLAHWAKITHWEPSSLKIRDYKSRWGSCDRLKRITLNKRLMMAPPAVVDYVIIHELAHLKELNHSGRFWALVEQYCPGYKIQRNWLKKHSAQLQLSAEI